MRRVSAALAVAFVLAAAGPAAGSTPHDLRGTWDATSGIPDQTWTIQTMDLSTGALSGEGAGGPYTWPITGTATGDQVQMHFDYRDSSYEADVTGTIASDGNTISGTYDDDGDSSPDGSFTVVRRGGQQGGGGGGAGGGGGGEGGGGGGGGGGEEHSPYADDRCTNATTLLVTCANAHGPPGICGPSGTIFSQCQLPTVLPEVCGPSFGTILVACRFRAPAIVACGGFGTILPQCTGPANPVLVCGPSGTILPQCNFGTRINASLLRRGRPATIELDLRCPPPAVVASPAAAAQRKKDKGRKPATCKLSTALEIMRSGLLETLDLHAQEAAKAINHTPGSSQDRAIYGQRARRLAENYLRPDATLPVNRELARHALLRRAGPPEYVGGRPFPDPGPDGEIGGAGLREATDAWLLALERAVKQYRRLQAAGGRSSSAPAAGDARLRRPRVVKRIKVLRGKGRRVRIKLSRKVVRALVKEAQRSRSKRTVPVRFVVSYSGKVGGRRMAVARLVDAQMRVKAPARKRRR